MKEELKNSDNESGFQIPKGYFKSVEANIKKKLGSEDLDSKFKKIAFKVDDQYFDTIESRLEERLTPKQPLKIRSLINWNYAAFISGVAATILLIFYYPFNSKSEVNFNDLSLSAIESYIVDETLSSYELAYVLNVKDVTMEALSEDIVSDQEIENYIIDNANIEELIIE